MVTKGAAEALPAAGNVERPRLRHSGGPLRQPSAHMSCILRRCYTPRIRHARYPG